MIPAPVDMRAVLRTLNRATRRAWLVECRREMKRAARKGRKPRLPDVPPVRHESKRRGPRPR